MKCNAVTAEIHEDKCPIYVTARSYYIIGTHTQQWKIFLLFSQFYSRNLRKKDKFMMKKDKKKYSKKRDAKRCKCDTFRLILIKCSLYFECVWNIKLRHEMQVSNMPVFERQLVI